MTSADADACVVSLMCCRCAAMLQSSSLNEEKSFVNCHGKLIVKSKLSYFVKLKSIHIHAFPVYVTLQ